MVGSLTPVLKAGLLDRLLLPLVAFAAGNSLYIGTSDLIREVQEQRSLRADVR